jgi:hypothetical protein
MQYIVTANVVFSTGLAEAKDELKKFIKQLTGVEEKPDTDIRIQQANDLIEAYVAATEQRPDSFELYGLGGYILADYLGDQHKEHRKEEYPFKTDNRMKKNHARHRTVFMEDTN